MSIRLYSGIMGSGKTYRVVYELVFTDLLKKYFVFHNLENLKIDSKYLKEYGKNTDFNPPDLFTYEYQTKLSKQIREEYDRNILWIIEECDKIGFERTTAPVKEWLSMHRHLGQDIYLISQSKWNISKDYMNLLEVEIQGKRGFVFDAFIYSWFSGGEKIATDRLPKKKEIYEKYTSFHIPELKKKRSKLLYWIIPFFLISFIGTAYFFFFGLPNKFTEIGKTVNKTEKGFNKKVPSAALPPENLKPVSSSSSIDQDPEKKYYLAGIIKMNIVYLTDQDGNLFNLQHLMDDPKIGLYNERSRKLCLLNEGLPIYKPTYIKTTLLDRAGSGRETRPDQAQAQAAKEAYRELWINIY